jgi:hypothetical protein
MRELFSVFFIFSLYLNSDSNANVRKQFFNLKLGGFVMKGFLFVFSDYSEAEKDFEENKETEMRELFLEKEESFKKIKDDRRFYIVSLDN